MQDQATWRSHKVLFLNTFAFTVCFAAWMLNGVLVTFLSPQIKSSIGDRSRWAG